jgi:hypothetical protein
MKRVLLLLGFLAGTAHAADEYYSLQPILTTATALPDDPGLPGTLTVSEWFETNGFGKSGCPNPNYCDGPGAPGWSTPLIGYQGVTETLIGKGSKSDIGTLTATRSGLYCNG